MKKIITIIGAVLISFSSFAQKDEVKAIEKAIKKGEFPAAKSAVMSADALVGNMDDKTKAKFYFLKVQAMYADGQGSDTDIDTAIASIKTLKEIEEGIGKLNYTEQADAIKLQILNTILNKANDDIGSKDYAAASVKFEQAYAISPRDTTYLYYAASTSVNAGDYDKSLGFYKKLREMNFKGMSTTFVATNKETGVEENFGTKVERDFSVKAGTHIKPTEVKSDSKSAEIIKNIALIYVAQDMNEEALEVMADARTENPDDIGLILSEANVNLKMGNKVRFKELMELATSKDPKNPELQYNLGVLAAEGGNPEEAKKYYKKAIELNPEYTDAYTNMAVVILEGEAKIVEEMNGLGTSSADNKRYDELKDERLEVYKEAIPFLEKAIEFKKTNIDAAKTLMNIYSAIGETDKFKAMKAKVEEMESNSGN